MKLVWSPETASKAYLDTVKQCELFQKSGEAELISAMAAGWNAKFIVETWSQGTDISICIGLAIASRHTGAKHTCIVPDEHARSKYLKAMGDFAEGTEVIIGEREDLANKLVGVDFLVVDCRLREFLKILRAVKLGSQGAVFVSRNAYTNFRWRSVCDSSRLLVRSVVLPVGKGLEIAHVGAIGVQAGKSKGRWFKHVDRQSGEEHVIRKQ